MQRLLILTALVFAGPALAETTLDVTLPGGAGICSYTTGAVTTGTTAGHLQATATAMSAACGSGGTSSNLPVEFGPASQLSPSATTLPGTSGSVSYAFQPLHATSCTGSFTGGNGSSTASFSGGSNLCTGTACNSLVSNTANFTNNSTTNDANYSVTVTCTGDGSPATTTATVVVPHTAAPPQGNCKTIASSTQGITNFTQLSGNQNVFYFGSGPGTGNLSVDVGSFASSWHGEWPGSIGIQPVFSVPRNKYLSQVFVVPTPYYSAPNAPADLYGQIKIGASQRTALIAMTISTSCGDFSNPALGGGSTVVPGCYRNNGRAADLIQWNKTGSCKLQDGHTYYLNIINADISNVTPTGGSAASVDTSGCAGGTTCTDPFQLKGNFGEFVPQ
ncbi:MAG TPA: hypothetical protein VFN13_01015 [Rudaea sp.]|nr:hypothetical protein [Rudaea sp.]